MPSGHVPADDRTTMKIHEYQGKEIFRKYGVPTPRGYPAMSVDEAFEDALALLPPEAGG